MEGKLRLELPLLLPEAADERDCCVERLRERLAVQRGVADAHIDRAGEQAVLCLHYDANLVSLSSLSRIARQAGSDISGRYRHEQWTLTGMDCADCAVSIEHLLGRLDGVMNLSVAYASERLHVEYDSRATSRAKIIRQVRRVGYGVEDERGGSGWLRQNWELCLSLLAGLLLALAYFGESQFSLPRIAAIALYAGAYAAGGFDASRHAIRALLGGRFDIDVLMVVAALGAAAIGHWSEGAVLLFLFSFGHALEHYAMGRARRAIRALSDVAPQTAWVLRDSQEAEVAVDDVRKGDEVIVRNGERVPIDGVIVRGSSALDQSPITGESMPVEKAEGDQVFAGSINGPGPLVVRVTKLAKDSTLARVIEMVEEGQTRKSPSQRFAERFAAVFVPLVLVGVVLLAALPPLVGALPFTDAFLRAMTILVAASPCALAISTPAAVLAAVAQAARSGVLIKGGVHLENLGDLRAIALDKTGTLTRGKPEVTDLCPTQGVESRDLLRVAAAVERGSAHPLAQAVAARARAEGLDLPEAENPQALSGHGIEAHLGRQLVRVGSARLFAAADAAIPPALLADVERLQSAGRTTVIVKRGDRFLGAIGLADRPRPEARAMIERLKRMGIRALVMITGDNARAAAAIARELGVTDYKADLLPEDKVSVVRRLVEEHGKVAMVGDGINDAPAMKSATVGVAMGAGGTDVALETADIALMADDLSKLPLAVRLSQRARRTIVQNIGISLAVIAVLVVATLAGAANMGVVILVHEGSTLLVVGNALRLLRFRGQ